MVYGPQFYGAFGPPGMGVELLPRLCGDDKPTVDQRCGIAATCRLHLPSPRGKRRSTRKLCGLELMDNLVELGGTDGANICVGCIWLMILRAC